MLRGGGIPTIPTSQLGASSELSSSIQSQGVTGVGMVGGPVVVGGSPTNFGNTAIPGTSGEADDPGHVIPTIDTSMIVPSESEDMESDDPFA
jgi:hypothetical protein